MEPAQSIPIPTFLLWLDRVRNALPIVVFLVCVVVGVPLFLRMPVWCDITLYDMAAKNILTGGVHYRDLFDTNTPGYVWLLAGLRSVIGWSSEALRATDLLIFGGIVLTLDRLAKLGGATLRNRLWMVAGCAGFYLFTQEMVHAQRDVWLTLPALLAVLFKLKRIARPTPHLVKGVFLLAAVEGLLWAAAVWIKPHFLLVAGGFWLATAPRLAGSQLPDPDDRKQLWLRVLLIDLGGSLLTGGLLGAAGVAYLFASGTWGPFREVMTVWNVGYMEATFGALHSRAAGWLNWFPPWSYLLPLTAGVTIFGLIDCRFFGTRAKADGEPGAIDRIAIPALWHKGGTDAERYTRAAIGLVYLMWCAQSLILQRPYEYVHAAEILIGLAVWAGFRWNVPALFTGWFVALHLAWVWQPDALGGYVDWSGARAAQLREHRMFEPDRLREWAGCFNAATDPTEYYRRQDALRVEEDYTPARLRFCIGPPNNPPPPEMTADEWLTVSRHPASISWAELNDVANFLKKEGVKDHELICWHDSPHPLYLMLNVKPGLRFMHVNTARLISFDAQETVLREFEANHDCRFVVIDLRWYGFIYGEAGYTEVGRSPTALLPPAADWVRDREDRGGLLSYLPFDTSRTVFRSGAGRGRYVVFQIR